MKTVTTQVVTVFLWLDFGRLSNDGLLNGSAELETSCPTKNADESVNANV